MRCTLVSLVGMVALLAAPTCYSQEMHEHPAAEVLGTVSFSISCAAAVQSEFNRGVALLHSFAYNAASQAFQSVAEHDPKCSMAHWGIAMSNYHELWEPAILPDSVSRAQREIATAETIGSTSDRERQFVHAAGFVFQDAATVPLATRTLKYERAMSELAAQFPNDIEVQAFYALALLGNASPSDKTHSRQQQAAIILEPLFKKYPQHPGIPHYLIHAYDNGALADKGLPAARAYASIAPSAPHALHMPSHIFTRLGLWEDSIASNTAAREAAHRAGDTGEELHAMDYLVYAQLQLGRDDDAAHVVNDLKRMQIGQSTDFKIGYASTAMPIRYALERGQWTEAAALPVPELAPPHVKAIAIWARSISNSRLGKTSGVANDLAQLQAIEDGLQARGISYWAVQVRVLRREAMAWAAQTQKQKDVATTLMRQAADEEDAVEKLPVTPGPIIPAREQLGTMLLEQGRPRLAVREFKIDLTNAPNRRGGLNGLSAASKSAASDALSQ